MQVRPDNPGPVAQVTTGGVSTAPLAEQAREAR